MEVENNRTNKRTRPAKLSGGDIDVDDELEADAETTARNNNDNNRLLLRPWHHPSSRIFRVSRASGGKDRHSKVYTSKGLRDRRVRLSVSTAIQFYDLQDRLGYDQPSKAIEWLIKAAASAIAELPSLDSSMFPQDFVEQQMPKRDHDANQNSSTSETSKGSVLSLSRSEIRVKARERARERAAKDRDSTGAAAAAADNNLNASLNSQNSFTDLLTGGGGGVQKQHIAASTADYFGTDSSGLFDHHQHHQQQQKSTSSTTTTNTFRSSFGNMVQFGNAGGEHHHPGEMQQFGFLQQQEEHFFPVHASAAAAEAGGGDHYNLNFGLANFHRGTLQSNSLHHNHNHHQHHHHHHQVPALQRLSPLDGSGAVHFLFGSAATANVEGQYPAGFDAHLQLCDGYKHMELKGKGKG